MNARKLFLFKKAGDSNVGILCTAGIAREYKSRSFFFCSTKFEIFLSSPYVRKVKSKVA